MKKPVALFWTDLHLKKDNIELCNSIADQLVFYAEKYNIQNIFFGGDAFHNRKEQPLNVLLSFRGILNKLNKAGLDQYYIEGNHDKSDQSISESYISVYEDTIRGKIQTEHDEVFLLSNLCIMFLPYYKEGQLERLRSLRERIKQIRKKNPDCKFVLLMHDAVSGVRNNNGSVVTNDLTTKEFLGFDLVFAGHYHNRSEVGSKIYYIGSTHQNNFGEDQHKGFVLLYDDLSFEYLQTKFPHYLKVTIKEDEQGEIPSLLEEYRDSKDYVRFEFEGDKAKIDKSAVEKLKKEGIDVKYKESDAITQQSSVEHHSFDRNSLVENYKVFCEENEYEEEEGLKYLNEVLN